MIYQTDSTMNELTKEPIGGRNAPHTYEDGGGEVRASLAAHAGSTTEDDSLSKEELLRRYRNERAQPRED